jgi:transcriptional regulator with XRE-family HTH domain
VTEHAVSAWLTGKRQPRLDALINLAQIYDVDARVLMGDPLEFAQKLGDRDRILTAERNLAGLEGRTIEPALIEKGQLERGVVQLRKSRGGSKPTTTRRKRT